MCLQYCGSLTTVIFVLSSIMFLGEPECSLVFLHSKSYHTGFSASTSVKSCQTLILAIGCFEVIIATLTSLPFLLRIRGVFNDSMPIVVALRHVCFCGYLGQTYDILLERRQSDKDIDRPYDIIFQWTKERNDLASRIENRAVVLYVCMLYQARKLHDTL